MVFYKLESFLSIFLACFIGFLYSGWEDKPAWRKIFVSIGIICAFLINIEPVLAWNRSKYVRFLVNIGLDLSEPSKAASKVTTSKSVTELVNWFAYNSEPNAPVLCEFPLSPSILQYAKRPINQHCFFECEMRLRYRELCEKLFMNEDTFYNMCQKYKTRYFVYNAHILLRTDPWMSFRYAAAKMNWNTNWVAYKFHFNPGGLKHFELVYQNAFFRVYKALNKSESKMEQKHTFQYEPVFDGKLFKKEALKNGVFDNKASADWFFKIVDSENSYNVALYNLSESDRLKANAISLLANSSNNIKTENLMRQSRMLMLNGLNELNKSIKDYPRNAKTQTLLGVVLANSGKREEAIKHLQKALNIQPEETTAKKFLDKLNSNINNE